MSSTPIQPSSNIMPLSQEQRLEAMLSPTCSQFILNCLKMEAAATTARKQDAKTLHNRVELSSSDLPPLEIFLK